MERILQKLRKLRHFNLNTGSDNDACTALHLAIREGHYSIIKMLIREGASLTVPAFDNQLPLHFAAIHGKAKILNLLLEK